MRARTARWVAGCTAAGSVTLIGAGVALAYADRHLVPASLTGWTSRSLHAGGERGRPGGGFCPCFQAAGEPAERTPPRPAMTTCRATLIRSNSLPRWPHRPSPVRTTGPVPGLEKGIIMCGILRLPRQPGRRGLAGRTIQDIAATASVATGQHRPAPTATLPQRCMMIAPRLPPHTMQLCIHCRHRPAGF